MSQSGSFFNQKKSFLNGELTRALIRRKGLRQYQIARRVRIHPATFAQLLNREYKADAVLINSLAQVLSVKPSVLTSDPARLPFCEVHDA